MHASARHPDLARRHDLPRRGGRPRPGQALRGRRRATSTSTRRRASVRVGERIFREGDELSIDGTTGEVIAGALATRAVRGAARAARRRRALDPGRPRLRQAPRLGRRRAPAAHPRQRRHPARRRASPRALGAQGIGLCRTEHMFFADERIPWVRQMILADDDGDARRRARQAPAHAAGGLRGDLRGAGGPAGHHPPARSAAPRVPAPRARRPCASWPSRWGSTPPTVKARAEALAEANPMLGLRGCRLGITFPEIYEMQVRAIVRAACRRGAKAGETVRPEIMVPLVGTEEELVRLREMTPAIVDRVLQEEGVRAARSSIGTMIEVPRAALVADQIARHADFFSFGTNDLTQMTYGFSRDDAGRFLPQYVEHEDPAVRPLPAASTRRGWGSSSRMACERGRETRAGPQARRLRRARRRSAVDRLLRRRWASTTSPARPTGCRSPGWPRRGRASPARPGAEEAQKTPKPAPQAATATARPRSPRSRRLPPG